MSALLPPILKTAVDLAWAELERQAEAGKPGPYIDREDGTIDGKVDLPRVVEAILTVCTAYASVGEGRR